MKIACLAGALLCFLSPTLFAAESAYDQEITAWRAGRLLRLTRPDGWLTLIGRHPLQTGVNTIGIATDNSVRLAAGPDHLGQIEVVPEGKVVFTAASGVAVTVDGVVTAQTVLQDDGKGEPTVVASGTVSFHTIDRNGVKFLRVRDSEAKRRKEFAGLDYFPVDPSWRIVADWVPFDPPKMLPVRNIIGGTSQEKIPGKAVFQRDGKTYELLPIQEGTPEEPLFFVISDLTSGKETYLASRFLYADAPHDGKIVLDFNEACNPPCAFSPFATCPLPREENRLPLAITAGEKKYRGGHE